MKKTIFKFFSISAFALTALFLNSCGDDDVKPTPKPKSGTITKLDAGELNGQLDKSYSLKASTNYKLTGAFTIVKGGELTIPAGTKITANAKGTEVFIAALKGGKININGTNDNPVVITSPEGKPGDWGGLTICGEAKTTAGVDATAEVGDFKYGGTKDDDNSGVIKNLVIKGTGAQINPDSQYNGISLYAVGSKTVIENVAVFNGADDGIEFFGGTVSVKNIYLENNEDDSIDWTEGWNGTVENAYISHTKAGFSTALEGDKVNNNPKFKNLTAVSIVGGKALQFKKQSGATITNLYLKGYDKNIDMKDKGPLANVKIDGKAATTTDKYNKGTMVDISGWNFVKGQTKEVVELKGDVTSAITLSADKAYQLTGPYVVKNGGKLTIEAGTKIAADPKGTSVYIAVLMGGKIEIKGTAAKPVVISSPKGEPGDWGGLTICGKAKTTAGVNATAEVGDFKYGGNDSADNSGSIDYLVIRGTGAQINPDSQYNGVSLYAVGSGTKINNVSVIDGSDDGIEFFGGSVNVTNIYLENNEDDAVDWTEGWDGKVTNTYISHTKKGFSTAFEGDKVNNNPKFDNVTAICSVKDADQAKRVGLQFKKQSGATITNLYLEGYTKNIDMKNDGPLANVKIDGKAATTTDKYNKGTKVDVSGWSWKSAKL